jgi:hypothetical protein
MNYASVVKIDKKREGRAAALSFYVIVRLLKVQY